MARLTVAISTAGDRLRHLHTNKLPQHRDVIYDIFVQAGNTGLRAYAKSALSRPDINLVWLNSNGVAFSRNAALRNAVTEFLMFADDDIVFEHDAHHIAMSRLSARPDIDFICCRLRNEMGADFKSYPRDGARVRRTNCARVGTPEIALRVASFCDKQLAFDTKFGAGTPCYMGDEYILLCDALRSGLRGEHAAIYHGAHATDSTGHIFDTQSLRIRRQVMDRALGASAWLYRIPFAFKHVRRFPGWRDIFAFIF